MNEKSLYIILLISGFIMGLGVFIALFFVNAPYGRHARKGWGATLSARYGWLIMETPAAVLFALFFWVGSAPKNIIAFLFFGMWEVHYIHRALIYPFTRSNSRKKMPFLVAFFGLSFNIVNSFLNGYFLFSRSGGYSNSWLLDPRFILGLVLFITGFVINRWSDWTLRSLRKTGEAEYYIPYGGLYRWVSCPNYLGEIIEWAGWAVATWSLPGLFFLVWTISNLSPRARAHHLWYKEQFPNYPKERKALIPGAW